MNFLKHTNLPWVNANTAQHIIDRTPSWEARKTLMSIRNFAPDSALSRGFAVWNVMKTTAKFLSPNPISDNQMIQEEDNMIKLWKNNLLKRFKIFVDAGLTPYDYEHMGEDYPFSFTELHLYINGDIPATDKWLEFCNRYEYQA